MSAPERIGRYEVTGVLGEGTMGIVYRARDPGLERDVALKVMKAQAADADADSRARFQREARAVARLSHPNIVTVFEFGEHDGRPFMAMELLEGVDLQRAIAAGLRPDPRGTLPIVLQVLAGLGHAHEHGLVHRDLKPSNVFLPQARAAKLTDFGLARLAGGSTATGGLAGTPAYMSPEQVQGGRVGPPSDLFSVGLILYELVTGERAFRGDSIVALLYQIAHESPDLALLPRGAGWSTLRDVLARAVAREPEARWPDALSMHAALLVALRELGGSPDWQAPCDVALLGRAAPVATRPGSWSLGSGGQLAAADRWSLGSDRHTAPALPARDAAGSPVAAPTAAGGVPLGAEPGAGTTQASGGALPPARSVRWPARQTAVPLAAGAALALAAAAAVFFYLGARARGGAARPPLPGASPTRPSPASEATSRQTPPYSLPVAPAPAEQAAPAVAGGPVAPGGSAPRPESPGSTADTAAEAPEASENLATSPEADTPSPEADTVEATATTLEPAPSAPSARLTTDLANTLLEQGRYRSAADAARAVLAREPENPEAGVILEEAEFALAIEACIADVETALAAGRREEAAERLGPCLARAPGDARLVALRRRLGG